MPRMARFTRREFDEILAMLLPALRSVDRITLGTQHRAAVSRKPDGSEVTTADRATERLLRRTIGQAFPGDAIVGEEFGGELPRRGRCWLVDPIDGTASYVLGLGTFGTLVALVVDDEPVFGCIHLPAMHETTYAGTGLGCWLRRGAARPRRVHVAPPRKFTEANTGLTSYKASDLARRAGPWRLSALLPVIGRVRLVGDCVQYALLCRGELDAAIDPLMNPWDIAPLVVCVREAGGSVGDLHGRTRGVVRSRSFVAASTARLRRAICARVAPRDGDPG
jgi:histidinol-phosphatase